AVAAGAQVGAAVACGIAGRRGIATAATRMRARASDFTATGIPKTGVAETSDVDAAAVHSGMGLDTPRRVTPRRKCATRRRRPRYGPAVRRRLLEVRMRADRSA